MPVGWPSAAMADGTQAALPPAPPYPDGHRHSRDYDFRTKAVVAGKLSALSGGWRRTTERGREQANEIE